jgi:hypothetical protein
MPKRKPKYLTPERYKKLYGNDEGVKHEARVMLIAEFDDVMGRLQAEAFRRYMDGKITQRLTKDGDVVDLTEFEVQEGFLSIAAGKARREMLGVDAPGKVALTDPSGERPYSNLSDEELEKKILEIAESKKHGTSRS